MTRHASERAKDRGIPEIARWLLIEFGVRQRTGNGTESYSFDKKTWREVERFFGSWPLKRMEQLQRVYMVMSDHGNTVTVAFRD